MSYPVLTARAANNLAAMLGREVDEGERRKELVLSEGPHFDEAAITAAANWAQEEWSAEVQARERNGESSDVYLLEAFMASRVHRALRELPTEMLQDFGFWRYLALFPYRWYLQMREGGPTGVAVKPQDFGGRSPKSDAAAHHVESLPVYQLILRTFLWGKVAFDEGESPNPYRRATLVNETGGAVTDVWHSHIVRIQLGQLGALPRAFLDSICSDPKANTRDRARDVEKRLTRMKHTVLFDVYDLAEASKLVDAQKKISLDDLASNEKS
jgi:hypothetical protein